MKHGSMWGKMKRTFDESFKFHFETMIESGVQPQEFYGTNGDVIALFADANDFDIIYKEGTNELDRAKAIHRVCTSSAIGRSMFASELVKVRRTLFVGDVKKAILQLASHGDVDPKDSRVCIGSSRPHRLWEVIHSMAVGGPICDVLLVVSNYSNLLIDDWVKELTRTCGPETYSRILFQV